jgi:hypothetical protein
MTGCNAEGNDDGACSVLNEFANNEPSLLCRILVAQLRMSFVACHWVAHDGADARAYVGCMRGSDRRSRVYARC